MYPRIMTPNNKINFNVSDSTITIENDQYILFNDILVETNKLTSTFEIGTSQYHLRLGCKNNGIDFYVADLNDSNYNSGNKPHYDPQFDTTNTDLLVGYIDNSNSSAPKYTIYKDPIHVFPILLSYDTIIRGTNKPITLSNVVLADINRSSMICTIGSILLSTQRDWHDTTLTIIVDNNSIATCHLVGIRSGDVSLTLNIHKVFNVRRHSTIRVEYFGTRRQYFNRYTHYRHTQTGTSMISFTLLEK